MPQGCCRADQLHHWNSAKLSVPEKETQLNLPDICIFDWFLFVQLTTISTEVNNNRLTIECSYLEVLLRSSFTAPQRGAMRNKMLWVHFIQIINIA